MIFVTVGSREYPFDRLFSELDRLVSENVIKERIFAQIGTSNYKPVNYEFVEYLSQEEFIQNIEKADIIITHGASGSIMKALYARKKIIAVTRLEKYGEHIDNHQVQNNKAFGDSGYVLPVFEMEQLSDAYEKVSNNEIQFREWKNENPNQIIDMIDELIISTIE